MLSSTLGTGSSFSDARRSSVESPIEPPFVVSPASERTNGGGPASASASASSIGGLRPSMKP
jgi:hypothetical protein